MLDLSFLFAVAKWAVCDVGSRESRYGSLIRHVITRTIIITVRTCIVTKALIL